MKRDDGSRMHLLAARSGSRQMNLSMFMSKTETVKHGVPASPAKYQTAFKPTEGFKLQARNNQPTKLTETVIEPVFKSAT